MKKIVMTGGGTAGHVTPNIALFPLLKEEGFEITYIGSYGGIEKELVEAEEIPYFGISTGKLRRYFDLKNLSDPFRIIKGYFEAIGIIRKVKPDVVFSKGGFVSVPVVYAAKLLGVPVILHESDMTPGLANRLCSPKAKKICCNFPETAEYLPASKAVVTGSPIRKELLDGSKEKGLDFCCFDGSKPVLMVMGGSIGSVFVNSVIRESLDTLLDKFDVVHLCGKGNLDESLSDKKGYRQFEYISNQLCDLFAMADMLVSRAGANAICEILALRKPNILIPLSAAASRGDQILNADSFVNQGFSEEIEEECMTPELFLEVVDKVYTNRQQYVDTMKKSDQLNAAATILEIIKTEAKS